MTYTHEQLEHFAEVLRDRDYVVIPRERHRVLTVEKAVSTGLLENLSDDFDAKNFEAYMDSCAARSMSHELMKIGAVTKDALGPDPDKRIYRWRYQAGVILPKP